MIRVEGISKSFGKIEAVRDVSFEISRGEIVGLLGPNGAGKTTTMRIITGYLYPDKGKVYIENVDITEAPREVKKKIGYLPEDNPLYPELTPYELLAFSGRMYGLVGEKLKERIKDVVEKTGIREVLTRPVGELSKGYRQRVGLARALLHDPSILILDEPTNGLDPQQIIEIRNLIKELSKEKTVIVSTHILQEVQAICDRVIIINRGSIVAQGSPAELTLMAKGGNLVHVIFKGSAASIEEKLKLQNFVEEIKLVEEKDGEAVFAVRGPEGRDIREALFEFAKSNNIPLLEMWRERASLEEVFLKLTGGDA